MRWHLSSGICSLIDVRWLCGQPFCRLISCKNSYVDLKAPGEQCGFGGFQNLPRDGDQECVALVFWIFLFPVLMRGADFRSSHPRLLIGPPEFLKDGRSPFGQVSTSSFSALGEIHMVLMSRTRGLQTNSSGS